jgi:exonuclease III
MINIINVYLPTSEKVASNKEEAENVYTEEVESLMNIFKKNKSSVTFIAGDFNAKVGKRTEEDECMGRYSVGERNGSGELLAEFCNRNEQFITNTAFQHPARHITTWSQQRIDKASNTTKTIHNQIDYILINRDKKQNLQNATVMQTVQKLVAYLMTIPG